MTHGVQAFDVLEGALAIWQAWRYFPAETIHVIVVDPGWARFASRFFLGWERPGSSRRIMACSLWSSGMCDAAAEAVLHRSIENSKYMLPAQSNTFHGRDIFAPAAAHLAAQIERGSVAGRNLRSSDRKPDSTARARAYSKTGWLHRRRHSKKRPLWQSADESGSRRFTRQIFRDGRWKLETCASRAFAASMQRRPKGEMFAIVGSSGLLEIAMNCGSAEELSGIVAGTKFRLV